MLRNTPMIPRRNQLCWNYPAWLVISLSKRSEIHSPPIIRSLHNQKQIISSLPFAARIRKINLPPIPSYCKIVHKGHFPSLNRYVGGHQQFHFTWRRKEERKKKKRKEGKKGGRERETYFYSKNLYLNNLKILISLLKRKTKMSFSMSCVRRLIPSFSFRFQFIGISLICGI